MSEADAAKEELRMEVEEEEEEEEEEEGQAKQLCEAKSIVEPEQVQAEFTRGDLERPNEALHAETPHYNIWERQAVRIARYPKLHFWVALTVSALLGILGMTLNMNNLNGADHTGWYARGTVIGNRHTQLLMVRKFAEDLLYDQSVWEDLLQNVQPGWEEDNSVTGGKLEGRRSLVSALEDADIDGYQEDIDSSIPFWMQSKITRRLLEETDLSLGSQLAECDLTLYGEQNVTRLWPVWKAKSSRTSFLNSELLEQLCVSEANTRKVLEERSLCTGCPSPNQCLPPLSLVLFARITVKGGMDMTCPELARAWEVYEAETQADFEQCTADLIDTSKTLKQLEEDGLPESCPFGFDPSLVDEEVYKASLVRYTSSMFVTNQDMVPELYDAVSQFDKGSTFIQGAYDTQYQDFVGILADDAVGTDMILATASAIITTLAMLIHTRSPFLTLAGLLQICLSFPLAFFVYVYVFGLTFFPFLNFIGVFVVFALGADDIFVAVDKWKNFRNKHPEATTEQVAAAALPDAAYAMLLTTSTTSVAFFGTAVCPVAPIRVFAIFSGLLIFLDYIMVLAILFPCLCLYDGYRNEGRPTRFRWCISFEWCQGKDPADYHPTKPVSTMELEKEASSNTSEQGEDSEVKRAEGGYDLQKLQPENSSERSGSESVDPAPFKLQCDAGDQTIDAGTESEQKADKPSLIRRILLAYYRLIHKFRWPLLVASMAAFVVATYYASTKMNPPETSEVRILKPNLEVEDNYAWRMKLLSTALAKKGGSKAFWIWGVKPGDTGDQNNPGSWTQLVLDDSFNPSSKQAQEYLRDFCSAFFNEDFAKEPEPDYMCPINEFDTWLQAASNQTDPNEIWSSHCNGATGLPMNPDAFHPCISAWAQMVEEYSILSYKGKVQIIFFQFSSRVSYDSTNEELDIEWHLIDGATKVLNDNAPAGVSNAFFSSIDFWYYDTTTQMYNTAYVSIAIALAAAGLVILVSSKSLVLTLYSVASVAYVLMSVISMTLLAGWTLGFLESICFAIAIGISVDFVIHFSHAYATPVGKVDRRERTEFALISMGPSILAAAFTTIAGATIMFFTTIEFFAMFALVLFFTIIQATIGSFVVFLTLTNCIGTSQPTYFADTMATRCGRKDEDAQG